jgi:cell division protease FtsH
MGHRREVSEKTAQIVDAEVTRLLGEAYERARKTLVEHADLLKRMAEALLERETLNSDEIDALVRGEALPPRPTPSGPIPAVSPANAQLAKPPKPSMLGGPEVAPA